MMVAERLDFEEYNIVKDSRLLGCFVFATEVDLITVRFSVDSDE